MRGKVDGPAFSLIRSARFGEHRPPVLDELRRASMNLQPRQRLAEDAPARERVLRARARRHVVEPPLQTDHLAQPLDITPGERQIAESRADRSSPLRHVRGGERRRNGLKAVPDTVLMADGLKISYGAV